MIDYGDLWCWTKWIFSIMILLHSYGGHVAKCGILNVIDLHNLLVSGMIRRSAYQIGKYHKFMIYWRITNIILEIKLRRHGLFNATLTKNINANLSYMFNITHLEHLHFKGIFIFISLLLLIYLIIVTMPLWNLSWSFRISLNENN